MYRRIVLGIVLVIGISGLASSATLTVDWDGSGDHTTIQAALDAAVSGVDDITVADGEYTGVGNRDLDFGGKALTLSSAGGPENCIINCQGQGRGFIFANGEGADSVVDGFTIINGYHVDYGGAIECDSASPTIRNCTITDCSSYDGGAIDCYNASPTIENCVLSGNHADNDGGAIECYWNSNAMISGCTITGNSADHSGGGIDCYSSSPTIVDCLITGNSAVSDGGGIECYTGSSNIITNCLITGNSAGRYGGAVDCYDSSPVISYCTIEGNTGGIYADALSVLTQVTSCIIWNNGDDLFGCAATYSCIEDGDIGVGNTSEDPLFRTGTLGDYYLSSRWAGQQADSECIDTGLDTLIRPEFDPAFYTTSTDSEFDAELPDMGYHYADSGAPEEFELTIGVVPDPGNPHGVLEVVDFIVGTHPTYRKYSEVRLLATPDIDADGYKIAGWYGLQPEDIAVGGNEQIITILEDRDVSVEFMTFPMNRLTAEVLDTGGIHGTVEAIGGAPTGEPGQTWQYAGDMVIVQAVPDPGYQVRYWTGTDDDATATGSTFAYATMFSDRTVVVEFVPSDTAHLDARVIGGHGSVTPKRIDVAVGTTIDLLALPDPGYRVSQWTGTREDWSTEPNNYVVMTWSKAVTVEFEEVPLYTLYTNVYAVDGVIHGTIDPHSGELWNDGETVALHATPDPDYEVVHWYGTDDDASIDVNNFVTINGGDVFVYVEFREHGLPRGTITLNGDASHPFPTIQDAIDAAQDGDEVVVARGTYTGVGNRDLDLMGGLADPAVDVRAITVRSEFGAEDCIIDCGGTANDPHRGFVFNGPENILHAVIGFTITNGYADQGGALYYAPDAIPFVANCILENNHATEGGGAIWFEGPGEEEPDTGGGGGGGDTPDDFIPPNFDLDGDGTNESWDLNDDGIIDGINDATDTDGDGIPDVGNIEGARIPDSGGGDGDEEDGPHAFLYGGDILNNTSDGHGGGIYITNAATPWIVAIEISGNHAGSFATPPAYGGGVYSNAGSVPEIINCLFTLNVSTDIGGAIYLRDSDAIIRLCTIMYNQGEDYGDRDGNTRIGPKGGIAARDSDPEINHCIIGRSGYAMLGYGVWGNEYSWGDDLYECEATYSCIENGDDGDNNIDGNPLFVTGSLGDFYLSQTRGGQAQNSPCVNAGEENILEDLQEDYFLTPEITTSIMNQYDIGDGDLGYHYPIFTGPPIQHMLTMYVHGNGYMNYMDLSGILFGEVHSGSGLPGDPNAVVIYLNPGDRVYLSAFADHGYRVMQWSGTDDDTSYANFNTVTMYGDQEVHLYFEKSYIRTFNIPGDYTYTQVQMAIDDTRDGDTIILHSGSYVGTGFDVIGKDITITSAFPNDPDYVAATIFDFSSISGPGLYIEGSGMGTSVLNGITIANAHSGQMQIAGPGNDAGHRGNDGPSRFGQGLTVVGDHIIANCVIRDCEVYGWDASDGNDGDKDDLINGGNGGDGGDAGGAGLYIGANRYGYNYGYYYLSGGSPIIINCTITNCYAEAGDGARGGNGPEDVRAGEGGVPGRVFGGGVFCDVGTSPTFIDCVITDNMAVGGLAGDGGDETHRGSLRPGWGGLTDEFYYYYSSEVGDPTVYSAGDPRQYTANGAGVYVGGRGYGFDYSYNYYPYVPLQYPLTDATFINCTIARNITQGSISGRGGQHSTAGYMRPFHHYQIPSFGGGFYCAEDANTLLVDCRIVDNETQDNPRGGGFDDYFSADHYTGYGGGIAVQGSDDINPDVRIKTSHIARNFAPVGGGMHWVDSQLDIADSNIVENVAYVGGGMHFFDSINSIITRSLIQDNTAAFGVQAGADPNGAGQAGGGGILGAGGGIFGYTSDIIFRDTEISQNTSTFSGGGVYLGGHPEGLYPLLGIPVLENCLIVNNNAGNDGGGVSVNWYAEPIITNCTIADNVVTALDGHGGGLFCSFDSNTIVTDSIIWGNIGINGSQIAVAGGGGYYPMPSELDITFSDIYDFKEDEVPVIDPSAKAIRPGFDLYSLAANDDGSSPLVDIGFTIDFFGTEYSNLFVNNNGNVTFNGPLWWYTPFGLTTNLGTSIIAPFFADVDTTDVDSDIVTYAYGSGVVDGHNAFGVNWVNVGYFASHSDKLNSFQLIIVDRSDRNPGDFDIEFNYGQILWETGDASGGINGFGGFSARAGFSNGTGLPGTFYEFDGSGINGGLLDTNQQTGLIHDSLNSQILGRYVFWVTRGIPTMPGVSIYVEDGSEVYGWDGDTHMWDSNTNNIQDDPNFMAGYYLREYSNCIDAGEPDAVDAGLADPYTTQADGTPDTDKVDMGYHYRQGAPKYELIVEINPGSMDGPHGTVVITPSPDPDTGRITAGTMVTVTAIPDAGYRVREWIGTDNAPAWQETSTTFVINADTIIGVVFEVDVKRNLLVPTVYATIEEAVAAASPDDNIVLAPGEHYISDPNGIDFEGKNLTIMSTDPDEPSIIAETIINCQGTRFVSKRAFHFHNGEDNRSKIHGITIKNGYAFSVRGIDAGLVPTAMWPGEIPPNYPGPDPPTVIRAPYGGDASGHGYGGAILCENESSPTFENVVFYNNIVTGAQGGDGADGWPFDDPPYNDNDDAQPGGHAGDGWGNGYGGAVSCLQRSSPVIINCTFEDNKARGGMGGNGGDAGPLGEGGGGHENCGGDGGDAIGFGQGGAVYFASGSLPTITECTFINNNALDGLRGTGGSMTGGREWGRGPSGFNWVAHDGSDGVTITYEHVWGGALYYGSNCDVDVTDCNFVGNMAFESYLGSASAYVNTLGGAIFSDPGNTITLKDCDLVENLPGAVYAHSRCRVDLDNCTFVDNANPGAMSPEAPAGALYLGPNPESHQIVITDCDFRGNYTSADGGAIICKTDAFFTNCSFGGNTANGYGGAFYGYKGLDPNETAISLDFENCSFVDNEATYGGGLYLREFDATFNNCYFMTNEAENGGGLFLADGTVALDGGIMRGNRAVSDFGLGGAMACASTAATIENFVIEDNVVEGGETYGGGIMFYGADELITQTIKNCLFKGNSSSYGGGAIGCNIFVEAEMDNCTFDDNDAEMFGGALFCDWSSHPEINNSIFTGNGHHAVYEEQIGGDSQVTFSLFYGNPDGDIYDAGTGVSYTGAAAINTVNANGDNIDGDPLFEVGPLGEHYLAIASPAVNRGSALSVDLGLNLRTTRIDNAHDDGMVDLGYHYADTATLQEFQLIVSVIGGHGSVTPTSGTYYSGQTVTITAIPDIYYFVKAWGGGTLNDNSKELTNIVIMGAGWHGTNAVKHITVQFAQPRILTVGTQGDYTSIQRAIDDAEDGDIVVVLTGDYVASFPHDLLTFSNKDITLTGSNPDDEQIVADTVLSGYDFWLSNVGPRTVIEGITISRSRMHLDSSSPKIRNCNFLDSNWFGLDGDDGDEEDGFDGASVLGGAITMYKSSPEISNCRFDNCSVTGGDGGDGDDGSGGHRDGWDGGWAGRAYGGAVYAAWNSEPNFMDCVFNNCYARGGNGGNGGDSNDDPPRYYHGGRGGSWVWADSIEQSYFQGWWDGWEWGDKYGDYGWFYWFSGYLGYNFPYDPFDGYYDYWKYTGLGGAFYCEVSCSPVFTRCTFTNNNTYGGDSGIGGDSSIIGWNPGPMRQLDIETAGGAIYIGDGCDPLFKDCLIGNNTADTSTVDTPDDYYVSFGGGIAVEDNASSTFVNCDIHGNEACLGGGIYWVDSDAIIEDCNVVGNIAYHGGGLYSSNATGEITGTFFTNNAASVAPATDVGDGDPGITFTHSVFGRGGGYYTLSSLVDITDSVFRGNQALASGGGIFYVGSDQDDAVMPILKNSLIANNTAGRDGGGISINWFADPNITNCTISDNMVTGALGIGFGYGGGIYVGYNSGAYISDSIIWDNAGASGAQIAVTNANEHGPRPSEVTIVYSDIGPPYDPNAFDTLLLLAGEGQEEGAGAGTTSDGEPASVLVDGQTIYDGFDAGAETVRVIILLRDFTDMRKATDWDSAASAGLIREAIVDRQAMVLATLTSAQFTLTHRYENIVGFAGDITLGGLEILLDNPMVEHIEPDREVCPMLAQAIPLANALAARQAYNGTGISIAIVDTGIDYTHPRLGGGGFPNNKVIGGYDFGMNDPDPMPTTSAHGTACAGIAAGDLGTVGDYIGGVAYGAKLYALKMAYDTGGLSIAAGIAAWDWCVTNKNSDPQNPIMVVSNSWGFYGLPFNNSAAADAFVPALTAAANTLDMAGITILAASGNDGFAGAGISHPSAMSKVISVGAVYDTTDMVTGYSNTADLLDILAPADPMYTTDMVGLAGYVPGDYIPNFGGTSSATPFAAGCVASIQAAALDKTDRYLTPGEIRNLLIATGVPVTDTKVAITKPRVNLGAAIANLSSVPIYVDEGCILRGWDPNSQEWDVDTFNIMDDPLMVGDYFLSEPDAGQLDRSPCVDYIYNVEQGRLAIDFGLEAYTTRSDSKEFAEGVLDENALDLGYHRLPFEMKRHKLYYVVIIDPFELPDFDPVVIPDIPNGATYNYATQVELSITPPPFGFHAVWNGTDDDFSNEPENVVTMDDDKMVTVSFESIGYTLDAEVTVDANVLPNFVADITLDPPGGVYYPGTEVTMTVTEPPEGFQVRWTGADDGTIVDATNVVTMNSDKEVIAAYVEEGTEYYAVLVGISDYYDFFYQYIEFPYASRDARELGARLAEGLDWDEDNIYTLTDSQATKGAIRLVLQQLSEKLDSDDVLVFYFSGYGLADVDIEPIDEIDGLDEYLITYEYDRIRDDELGQMLAEFATDNYVVLIETDFSAGQIDGISSSSFGTYELPESVQLQFTNSIASETGMSFSGDEDSEPLPQDLNRNEAGVVLTACGVDEIAFYSGDFRHGVFTYYLLRAIEGGADWLGDNSGYVSAEEAYDYLAPRVDSYISDMVDIGNLPPGTTQGPRIYDADDESDIDILDVGPPDSEPTTWYVPGDASRIQEAVDNAKDGDVIILTAGTYKDGAIIIDKAVTITSTNPDDPDVVAGTVIDLSDTNAGFAVYFTPNAGPGAVLNGITIAANGRTLTVRGSEDGFDGGDIFSTGLIIGSGASPTIKNCVISGFGIRAGRGGDGDDEETNFFNGNGGNGGDAYGGGVYCLAESSPTFINTTITDCHVFGGDGGDGAEVNEYNFGGGRGGWGGWARGGGVFVGELAEPLFIHCTISNCTATGGNGGNGGDGGEVDDIPYPPGYGGSWSNVFYYPWQLLGYEGSYTLYSAYGGGVYCSTESKPRFVDCTISGNSTQGGVSGLGGEVGDGVGKGGVISGGRIYPFEIYEIPSFGGGVYCAPDSIIEFEGGEISSNVAPKPGTTLVIDPALGYGGGIVLDDTENAKFTDCLISGNEASIGGGVYWYGNALRVEDCNIMDNLAYNGGGIYGLRGDAVIKGGVVHGNFAGATETDLEQVVGRGGGIHLASVTAHIRDLELFDNQANASGGGLYMVGTEPQISTIKNCLFVNNKAGRDGGGISSNWFAQLILSNCTFANNWATGYFGFLDQGMDLGGGTEPNEIPQGGDDDGGDEADFAALGGGLYCGYESEVVVIDSIFNGNYAPNGRQLAVGTGFEFDPRPGSLDVSYSNVQGGQGEPAVLVEEGCQPYFHWSDNIPDDPMFVVGPLGNFYLSQIVAGQDDDSPCVDAGSDYASETGMDKYTTRSDDAFETYDVGVVDMGFHYPLKLTMAACKVCDLVFDGIVDMQDMAVLAGEWLNDCIDPEWCDGADINTDGSVNGADLLIFDSCWLVEDLIPPAPDPSEWDMAPQSVGAGSRTIEMSAKVTLDAWWSDQVEYYFECLTDPVHSSGWRQNYDPTDSATYVANPEDYEDTGLVIDTEYIYRVRVRDLRIPNPSLPDDNRNETAWSLEKSAIAGHELNPPQPNPAEWAIVPYATSGTSIRMVAMTATDVSGPVEYFFRSTDAVGDQDGPPEAGSDDWQISPIFEDTGLTTGVTYYYRVQVKDAHGNRTLESVIPPAAAVPDLAVVDFNPPLLNPPDWQDWPERFTWPNPDTGLTEYWHGMSVYPVNDQEGNGEEYYFECLDGGGSYDSGWLNALNPSLDPTGAPVLPNWYWVRVPQGGGFRYHVRTRDQSPNQNTGDWNAVLTVP